MRNVPDEHAQPDRQRQTLHPETNHDRDQQGGQERSAYRMPSLSVSGTWSSKVEVGQPCAEEYCNEGPQQQYAVDVDPSHEHSHEGQGNDQSGNAVSYTVVD